MSKADYKINVKRFVKHWFLNKPIKVTSYNLMADNISIYGKVKHKQIDASYYPENSKWKDFMLMPTYKEIEDILIILDRSRKIKNINRKIKFKRICSKLGMW